MSECVGQVNKAVTPEQLMIELEAARKIIEEQEARAVAAEMEVRSCHPH